MFKKNTNKKSQEIAEEIQDVEPVKKSAQKISSLFEDIFCEYDYDFDNSYVKWLLTSGVDIVTPVITLKSVITSSQTMIPEATDLLQDVNIPVDFVHDSTEPNAEEEDLIIL